MPVDELVKLRYDEISGQNTIKRILILSKMMKMYMNLILI